MKKSYDCRICGKNYAQRGILKCSDCGKYICNECEVIGFCINCYIKNIKYRLIINYIDISEEENNTVIQ
jgi:hypothetical protein